MKVIRLRLWQTKPTEYANRPALSCVIHRNTNVIDRNTNPVISRVDNRISLNCELLREKQVWGCQERGKLGGSQEMNLFWICPI